MAMESARDEAGMLGSFSACQKGFLPEETVLKKKKIFFFQKDWQTGQGHGCVPKMFLDCQERPKRPGKL